MSPLSFFCMFSASLTITFFYFLESWAINKQVGTTNILFCLIKVSRLASQLSTLSFLYLSFLLFLVSSFFYILLTISDLLCTLYPHPSPLSAYSLPPLLFIQVNDFIQLSDFVRMQRQGLS